MPLYRVSFMNHIVTTFMVEAENEDEAWDMQPGDVEGEEAVTWDCVMCEVSDVTEQLPADRQG